MYIINGINNIYNFDFKNVNYSNIDIFFIKIEKKILWLITSYY